MQLQCLHCGLATVWKRNATNLFAPLQPDELLIMRVFLGHLKPSNWGRP